MTQTTQTPLPITKSSDILSKFPLLVKAVADSEYVLCQFGQGDAIVTITGATLARIDEFPNLQAFLESVAELNEHEEALKGKFTWDDIGREGRFTRG